MSNLVLLQNCRPEQTIKVHMQCHICILISISPGISINMNLDGVTWSRVRFTLNAGNIKLSLVFVLCKDFLKNSILLKSYISIHKSLKKMFNRNIDFFSIEGKIWNMTNTSATIFLPEAPRHLV